MNRLASIALYTFREAVRNKILYSILFFAICLILLSTVLGAASMRQDERVLKNISLFGIALFSDIIAIFLGVTMVYQELERKTVYNLLSKPIARWVYFLGKYAGMSMVLMVQLALMSLALMGVMLVRGDAVTPSLLSAFWLIGVESLIVGAFALFFSSFSTPYVSGFLALGLWLVGRMLQELESYLPSIESAFSRRFLGALTQLFPDLSLFGLTTQLSANVAVPLSYVWNATVYGFSYIALFLLAGVFIFRRRDFI
jgi:ABC-type transport system involved in multi-copper enzyme maturation permease subunit